MKTVNIKVDEVRREKLRRLHTATHIVNYSARKVLGNHVWQNGSNLKPEYGTLDITHYKNLSEEEIFKIERLANDTIFENKTVSIEELDRTEAEKKYGFILYQGGAIPMKTLRIISILDSDIEACGGIHMLKTGGIGFVKIESVQKIQDGVLRLKFVVRDFAIEMIENKQKILSETCSLLSCDENNLYKTSEKFFNEWKEQKKEIEKLKKDMKETYINHFISSNSDSEKIESSDISFLTDIFVKVFEKKKNFKLEGSNVILAGSETKISDFKKEIKKESYNMYIK